MKNKALDPDTVARVAAAFGDPFLCGLNKDGKEHIIGLSEPFWAGLFCDENEILFEPTEKEFYLYEEKTGVWIPLSPDSLAQKLSQRLHDVAASKSIDDMGKRFLRAARSIRKLQAIVVQIRGICERRDAFNQARRDVHTSNQVLVFDSSNNQHVLDFSPTFYSRNALPVAYDPQAKCGRFLDELLLPAVCAHDVDLIQRWFGLAILQRNPAQRFLILDGLAGQGKTQLAILARLLVGRANCAQLRTKHLEEKFELYRLRVKTLLIGADVRGDFLSHSSASILKSLVGGDPLEAERKNGNEGYPLTGEFNVLITCNERLRVRIEGDVGAWRRRLLVVRFDGSPPEKKIPNFAEKLFNEEGEGILAWAIEGARKLLQEIDETGDFVLTDLQAKRVNDLLAESESLDLFVRSAIVRDPSQSVAKEELMEAYADFCADKAWEPVPLPVQRRRIPDLMLRHFSCSESHSVQRHNPNTGQQKAQRGYRGVTLSDSQMW